jgi:hypothetical protein
MSVLLIDAHLTHDENEARIFTRTFVDEANKYVGVTVLGATAALQTQMVGLGDHVLFFNHSDQGYSPAVLRLLRKSAEAGAQIIPIAMTETERHPPNDIRTHQSFDVTEELARGGLEQAQVPVVAAKLAQAVVAQALPTLARERMRLFLSHRRFDGESITRAVWRELVTRGQAQGVFRDLADVRAGEDAQDIIMERLAASDVVVFLDTPRSGESEWIARELEAALALNIPIVWVRIGPAEGRAELRVRPGLAPHLDLSDLNAAEGAIHPEIADKILQISFAVSCEAGLRVLEARDHLEALHDQGRIQLRTLDPQRMLFEVSLPRQPRRYDERPRRHLVQFFGRLPDDEDAQRFGPCARDAGYELHRTLGAPYDAAVLAGPIPEPTVPPELRDGGGLPCYVDSADAYLRHLEEIVMPEPRATAWGVVLSGAFPDDASPEQAQEIKEAVHAFARGVFLRGGTLIFGGHPTFQPMIFELGRELFGAEDRAERIRLYVSEHFLTEAAAREFSRDASTRLIPHVAGDRGKSLTAMRRAMLTDDRSRALVAIGGRGITPGRSAGVDEEVDLALALGMPVFLVGAAGGRAATLATHRRAAGWRPALNGLTPEQNEELLQSRDYTVLTDLVLMSLGY